MAEIQDNKEQENEEKVQHSLGEVIKLLNQLSSINLTYKTTSIALHTKQKIQAKKELHEQAKADAVVICAKYKLGKEAEAEAIKAVTEKYDEELKKIQEEYDQVATSKSEERSKNENEYEDLVVKEAETRKAYKETKKSKEYKEYLELNKKIEKDEEFYKNNKFIKPEVASEMLKKLEEIKNQNPLNVHVEELKKIEERKKQINKENKEIDSELKALETNFEKVWDELDINKKQALIETKNKDLVKPTLAQRLSNFFTGQGKRMEKAKTEIKAKTEERIEDFKAFSKNVGMGIVFRANNAKEKVKDAYIRNKINRRERINALYAKLTDSYQTKTQQMAELRSSEKENEVQDQETENAVAGGVPVPEAKDPIAGNDANTKVETPNKQDKKDLGDR